MRLRLLMTEIKLYDTVGAACGRCVARYKGNDSGSLLWTRQIILRLSKGCRVLNISRTPSNRTPERLIAYYYFTSCRSFNYQSSTVLIARFYEHAVKILKRQLFGLFLIYYFGSTVFFSYIFLGLKYVYKTSLVQTSLLNSRKPFFFIIGTISSWTFRSQIEISYSIREIIGLQKM